MNPDPHKIFHSKEAVARKIMSETYDKFGIAFASIINTFNPDIIVMGGGVSNLPAEFYRKINVAAKKYAYRAFSSGLKIVKNELGDSAGVFGAAALAQIGRSPIAQVGSRRPRNPADAGFAHSAVRGIALRG